MLLTEIVPKTARFRPTHVSTWFKPSWISARILEEPRWHNGRLERGALIVNQVDPLVELFPDLPSLFVLIERHGWFGPNESGCADIALVEDLSVWGALEKRDPDILHLPLGPADFIDHEVFRPLPGAPRYDVIQISCWSRRKRIELLIEAAARLPHLSFVNLGHFENNGCADELRYRDECFALAARLGANIDFPFGRMDSNESMPNSKIEINAWINRAKIGVLTAMPEGINRFKMECIAADRPVLVAADCGVPTSKHINSETGMLFEPSPEGLAVAIEQTLGRIGTFHPRAYLHSHTGKLLSLAKLKGSLRELCGRTGDWYHFDDIDWDGRNESLKWGRDGVQLIVGALRRHGIPVPEGIADNVFANA